MPALNPAWGAPAESEMPMGGFNSMAGGPKSAAGPTSPASPGSAGAGNGGFGGAHYVTDIAEGKSLPGFVKQTANTQASYGAGQLNRGTQTTEEGMSDLAPIMQLFKQLVGGDMDQINGILSPENDAISQQFGQIRNMVSASAPRGGGTASTFAAAPFEEQRQKSQLASQYRRHAIDSLGGLAMDKAGVGLNQQGLGLQGLSGASGTGLSQEQIDEQKAQRKQAMWMGIGKMAGQVLAGVATGGASLAIPGLSPVPGMDLNV